MYFRLKSVDFTEYCFTEVGATHNYEIKDTDKLITIKQWRDKCTKTFNIESNSLPNKISEDCNKLACTKKRPKSSHKSVELEEANGM